MRGSSFGDYFVVRSVSEKYPPEALVSWLKHQQGIGKFEDCQGIIPLPLMWDLINIENYVIVMLGKTKKSRKYCFNCREDMIFKTGDIIVQRAGLNLGKIIRIVD